MTEPIERIESTGGQYDVYSGGQLLSDGHFQYKEAHDVGVNALIAGQTDVTIKRRAIRIKAHRLPEPEPEPTPDEPPEEPTSDAGATPIPSGARIIEVPHGAPELNVTEGGTADAPVVYVGKVSAGDGRARIARIIISRPVQHVQFRDLHIANGLHTVNRGGIEGGLTEGLIENCIVESNGDGILLQTPTNPDHTRDVTIRLCIVRDAGGQGVYALKVQNLLIDRSVFLRNGSDPIRDHGLYLNECNNAVVRRNFIARSSGHAVKLSSSQTDGFVGGVVEDNVMFDQRIGVSLDTTHGAEPLMHVGIAIRRNTMIRHTVWAIWMLSGREIDITDNVIATKPQNDNQAAINLVRHVDRPMPHKNVTVTGNAISDWPMEWGRDRVWFLGDAQAENVTIADNPYSAEPPADLPDFEAMIQAVE